jgi:putative transposon-encoded protein
MPHIICPGGQEPLSLTHHGKFDQDGRKTRAKEEPMASVKEDDILVRDESFVKYERLLTKAETEGRIDGPKKCLVCGMRYMSKDEADNCCKINP